MSANRYPAESEYEKNKNVRKDVVLQILDWVHGQPHLPKVKEEDVIAFLTACLYSSEITKQTLDLNYTYRTHIPEMFANRDPANKQTDLLHKSTIYMSPLLGLTEDGCNAVYFKNKKLENISAYNIEANLRGVMYTHDQILYEEGAQKGWRIVLDGSYFPIGLLTKISPTIMIKATNYLMKASAMRLIAIHLIYPPSYVDHLVNFFKSFISKHIMDLIKIHNNIEEFYEIIPKTMLPSNVGGDLEDVAILHDRYVKRIMENRDYFIEEEKLRVDESLRPENAINIDTFLGVTGSFRKLDID